MKVVTVDREVIEDVVRQDALLDLRVISGLLIGEQLTAVEEVRGPDGVLEAVNLVFDDRQLVRVPFVVKLEQRHTHDAEWGETS